MPIHRHATIGHNTTKEFALTTEYFAEYHTAGIAARVAYQLVTRISIRENATASDRLRCVHLAIDSLKGLAMPFVRMALHSLAVWIDLGKPPRQWLRDVLYRDLMGYTFRRCFFDAYKETRRVYPRVTNRGVHPTPSGQASFLTETLTDA